MEKCRTPRVFMGETVSSSLNLASESDRPSLSLSSPFSVYSPFSPLRYTFFLNLSCSLFMVDISSSTLISLDILSIFASSLSFEDLVSLLNSSLICSSSSYSSFLMNSSSLSKSSLFFSISFCRKNTKSWFASVSKRGDTLISTPAYFSPARYSV
jgi:hypothetical protein